LPLPDASASDVLYDAHLGEQYFGTCHNLIDYRLRLPLGDASCKQKRAAAAFSVIDELPNREPSRRDSDLFERIADLYPSAETLTMQRVALPESVTLSIAEGWTWRKRPALNATTVAVLNRFAGPFSLEPLSLFYSGS
jgi:hypothetical protein